MIEIYVLLNNDDLSVSELEQQGFVGSNISTDGLLKIMHGKTTPMLTSSPELPSYVVESISNPQLMTRGQALIIIGYDASSSGEGDGWTNNLKS